MENRFKFRFFDKVSKEMCYPTEYNGKAEYLERRYDLADMFRFKDLIPMQCVGLKDKSGNLIYEYDVVRFGQEDEDIGIVMWNEDECKFVINEEFNKILSDFSNWYGEDLEILGNIFEHDFFGKDTIAWLKASNIL